MAEILVTKETRAIAREMHDEGVPHGIIKLCLLKAGFDRKQSLAVIRALPPESSAEAIAKYNAGKLGGGIAL